MQNIDRQQFKYSWEEAVALLRLDPAHRELIFNSYLTADIEENCRRFSAGEEFAKALEILRRHAPGAKALLDMPAGNGIATYAFAKAGFDVTSVEPNASRSVGRGAIAHALSSAALRASITAAVGEKLPFSSASFDIVYVRQGLHHATNLDHMVAEIARVLRPGGLLLACREHVVDNYDDSLRRFLDSQPDHQLYGGEHAYTLNDYRAAMSSACLQTVEELGPYDSIINMFPNTPATLRAKILQSSPGKVLCAVLPNNTVAAIGMWLLKRLRSPGRLYSFLAAKSGSQPPC